MAATYYLPHLNRVIGPEADAVGPALRHMYFMVSGHPPYELPPHHVFDGVSTWIDADGKRHLRIIRTAKDPKAPGGLRPYVAVDRIVGKLS